MGTNALAAKLAPIRALVVEGGGARGLAYGGALSVLEAHLPRGLGQFELVAGTSAGAIVALAVRLGLSAAEITELIQRTNWGAFRRRSLTGLLWGGGLHRLSGAREFLEGLMALRDIPSDLPMSALGGLRVYAWEESLEPSMTVEMGDATGGAIPVVDAVLASMAIPGYFEPLQWGGRQWVDGGIVSNYPARELVETGAVKAHELLGLRVDAPQELTRPLSVPAPKYLPARLARLLRGMVHAANDRHLPEEIWAQTIRIVVPPEISATDFDLNHEQQVTLFEAGKWAAESAVANWSVV